MSSEPTLFDPYDLPHARTSDPEASHDAAAQLSTAKTHCAALLRVYAAAAGPITDEIACARAGLTNGGWKRCSDLRNLGHTAWVLDHQGKVVRERNSQNRLVGTCRLTDTGWAAVNA